ncbi:MAG TPA: hypothetical protein VLS91_04035 [Acidimicrobiales bacterium]|nr:hypothetical protein [Acidimicrobiales bacterium]
MAGNRLFVRRRDGRIEVRLNDAGRNFVRDVFAQVVTAEREPEHLWHASLHSPIDPSVDADNPLATLSRQSETTTNAELALVCVDEEFLTNAEAWAWLTSLQVALRSVAVSNGVLSDERLTEVEVELRAEIETLQSLLFSLAECL